MRCAMCNEVTDIETYEKGSTFAAYVLSCTSCSQKGYMFSLFVPKETDVNELIEQYRSVIKTVTGGKDVIRED
jgi:hypothetical protein